MNKALDNTCVLAIQCVLFLIAKHGAENSHPLWGSVLLILFTACVLGLFAER